MQKSDKMKSEGHMRKRRSSDDDEDANGDLSLEIVRKSMLRSANNDPRTDGVAEIVTDLKEEKRRREKKKKKKSEGTGINVDSGGHLDEVVVDLKEEERKLEKRKKRKGQGDGAPDDSADNGKNADKPEPATPSEVLFNAVGTKPVESSENAVLRKLLRGPRYFDPPDNSWGTCYNCGEEGHMTINCTAAKRKKPCFICGSFEHNAKQCTKGRDCFICRQQGHRARDCPERHNSSKICLKCGDPGHDMFSCRNDYYSDDLKEIQCYVCGRFGHLCCKNYSDAGPQVLSCYRCGLSGHTGLACNWQPGDTNDMVCANSCYKCGLEGHFARECTNSSKASKRLREPSTPKQKSLKKKRRDQREGKSAPDDLGKTRRKRKSQYQEFASAAKTKSRGGWIADDSEYLYPSKSKLNNWRSPATPSNRRTKISSPDGSYPSSSHSSQKFRKLNYDETTSNRSTRYFQPRYSALRFDSSSNSYSNNRMGRSWW